MRPGGVASGAPQSRKWTRRIREALPEIYARNGSPIGTASDGIVANDVQNKKYLVLLFPYSCSYELDIHVESQILSSQCLGRLRACLLGLKFT